MISRNLIVQASNQCPCFCPGCYNHFSDNEEAPTADVIRFIHEYRQHTGTHSLTISGGDPLLRPDIVNYLDNMK